MSKAFADTVETVVNNVTNRTDPKKRTAGESALAIVVTMVMAAIILTLGFTVVTALIMLCIWMIG
jgi:hypothetical protein